MVSLMRLKSICETGDCQHDYCNPATQGLLGEADLGPIDELLWSAFRKW